MLYAPPGGRDSYLSPGAHCSVPSFSMFSSYHFIFFLPSELEEAALRHGFRIPIPYVLVGIRRKFDSFSQKFIYSNGQA